MLMPYCSGLMPYVLSHSSSSMLDSCMLPLALLLLVLPARAQQRPGAASPPGACPAPPHRGPGTARRCRQVPPSAQGPGGAAEAATCGRPLPSRPVAAAGEGPAASSCI